MSMPGIVSRRKYDELYRRLLKKEEELDELKLAQQEKDALSLENAALRSEIGALNAQLDATAAELKKTKNTLQVSEQMRKKLLKERRKP